VFLRALLLSVPALVINILVQGHREFLPEREARKKYKQLMYKINQKG